MTLTSPLTHFLQDTLLAVTNTLEGSIFLDLKSAPTVHVSTFLQQLLPELGQREISAAVAEYKDLGSPFEQVTAIVGECKLTFLPSIPYITVLDRCIVLPYALPITSFQWPVI